MPVASAQQVPATPADVAQPGGKAPGAPKLALVKVVGGFHDPVGVTAANDGSGRIFVVERAGRVRVVGKDGKVQAEPFIDLTNFNPLGKMGSTLVGKDVVYKQVLTDPGMFSIIYGGASGAMQSFHRRGMKQDEMLRIIAYVRTLDK